MSVIFKEKNYDQLILFLKKFLIIVLIMFLLLLFSNYIFQKKIYFLKNNLKSIVDESKKYNSLLENINFNQNFNPSDKSLNNNTYYWLIALANYADDITYSSLYFKHNKLKLDAFSINQNSIFKLIDLLEADAKFSDVKLLNIKEQNKYYFEIEAVIS